MSIVRRIAVAVAVLAFAAESFAASSLVISQVYGGAGCTTANCSTYKNDYIELYNRGPVSLPLNGWSVQYASSTGTGTWTVTVLPNVSIPAGKYFLISENGAASANGVNALPGADVTNGTIQMAAGAGKVALVSSTTPLTGACPSINVVDVVGYGSANCSETATAPTASTSNAVFRASGGCTDTDNNSADFAAAAASPRWSGSTGNTCGSPAAPATFNAAAGTSQVTLTWSRVSNGAIYNVKRATTSGGPYTTVASTSALTYTDTSVTNGVTYFYVVTAQNNGGESATSSEASATPVAPPAVSSIVRVHATPTNRGTVDYTVTFDQSVTGVDTTDFTLTTTGVTGASVTGVSGSGTTYTVTVNTGSGDGTIRLDLTDNDSIVNSSAVPLGGTGAANGSYTAGQAYTIDKTAPAVQSINRANANPTNSSSVGFTVTFTESVTGVNANDFAISGSGVTGATISSVTGSGATYSVTVDSYSGSGTLGLNLVDDDSITDAAANPLGGSGGGNGNFTGQTYTIDQTAPTVQSITRASANPTAAANVDFTVTFDESVTGVAMADFTLTTTGVTGASVTNVTGSGTTYVVTVSTGSDSGTIRLDVPNTATIADAVGNPLTAPFTTGETYTIDRNAPSVSSVVRAGSNPTNDAAVDYTVTFSQDVTGVGTDDFALTTTGVTGAAVSSVSGSGAAYTVTVSTGSGDGTIRLDVANDGSIQSTTNVPLSGTYTSGDVYTVDKTAPQVSSIVRAGASPSNASTVDFTVTFSEPVSGVWTGDFSVTASGVTGASVSNVSGSGTTYTVTVNTGSGDGTIRLDYATGGTVIDAAGNAPAQGFTTGESYTIDKTAPAVSSIVRDDADPSSAAQVHFTVTFTESVIGVDATDFTITAPSLTGTSIASVTGSGASYSVTVDSGTGNGTLRLDLAGSNNIVDDAGNATAAYTTGESYTMEGTPATPTGLTATAGPSHVALNWNAAAGATTYVVKRSTTSGSGYVALANNVATTSYDDTTASNGTTYYYVVSANGARGSSANSNQATATPAPLVPTVVFSQVYGGGGASSGSPAYTNDYVELFNRGTTGADISGFSLQYGSSGGNFGSSPGNIYTFPANTSIPAGKYLSVKLGTAGSLGATPTTDLTTTNISMAAASGKIALVTSADPLTCGSSTGTLCTLPDSRIIDLVSYGASNNGEGGTTVNNGVALDSTKGALRNNAGCTDTNNNNSDFTVATPATGLVPRTLGTTANVCGSSNAAPSITAPADPIASVSQDSAPFTVSLNGFDDAGIYNWSATAGTGVSSVSVTSGQGTANVTYTVTLQSGFSGTAAFTASLSDNVNAPTSRTVHIQVTGAGGNGAPVINTPANPIATVSKDAAPFTVSLSGSDDGGVYNWSATPGTGVASVSVTGGQGTATVTYTVTLSAGYSGTATFTATLSDNVNPPANQAVNITVNAPPPPSSHVTISQLYGGGGNTNATYTNDYIELYNPTSASVDLTGWTLQYASSTGNLWTAQPLGSSIAPGEYFLISLASGGNAGSALPQANISGDINMSGTTGKVALVNNGNPLSGTCPTADVHVVDFVGYGSGANCHEGSANAPAPSNTTSLYRAAAGATDTNQNGSDFTIGTPAPRRTSPITEIGPAVVTTDPVANASSAPRDANIIVTFTEPVTVDNGWYTITCAQTGSHDDATVAPSGTRAWAIIPNTNFKAGEQCTVTVFKAFVHDTDTDDSTPGTDTPASDTTWSFTVATGTAPAYSSDVHLTMGNPSNAVADPISYQNNYLMMKPEMSISYSRTRGTPNWVSWHLADEWVGSLTRVDTFRADPAVPPTWYRVLASDYFNSGFDRGHLTPNADRDKETSIPINQATFLMSNMIPQAPDNNQGPWANMENYLRTLLPSNELYIVAGGVGTGGTGSNGFATTIANGHVTVPEKTWKVVLVLPKASGDDVSRVTASTRTIAVVMPNVQGIRTNNSNDWMSYITTVDAVETLTGYDFFSNVPDAVENAIEGGTNGTNPPGAANQSTSTNEDTQGSFTLSTATPNNNATLTYTIVTQPAHGTLGGTNANRTYTPVLDFNGTDSFTYRINDGSGDSNVATVTITVLEVNDTPAAAADSKNATAGIPLTFPSYELTTNDSAGPSNESAQALTVTGVTPTASTHGTVSLANDEITYTADSTYSGPASFGYTVCDNGVTVGMSDPRCTTGTVNVTVQGVSVPPAPVATHFSVTLPANVTNGTPFNVTVTARDASNVTVTGYSGTIHFTSTSTGTLPSDYTFTAGDNGTHTFSVTLTSTGSQTVSVSDGSINGSGSTNVSTPAPVATHFSVTMPASVNPGTPFNVTVTALDAGNVTVTGYTGTVHFTSTSTGTLPPDYTFTAADNGTYTFSVTLNSSGSQSVTVSDGNISGTGSTNVGCPAASTTPINVNATSCARSTGNNASANVPGATSYTWQISNGVITSGQGTSSIAFTAEDAGVVTLSLVAVNGSGCAIASGNARSEIADTPTASIPAAMSTCPDSDITIPIRLTGRAPFTITWSDGHQQTVASGLSATRTVHVTSTSTLRITSVTDSASCGSGRSGSITLSVEQTPAITLQPESIKIRGGTATVLTVGTSSANVTYQWYEGARGDTSRPVGNGTPDFQTPELRATTQYWVRVTSQCGFVDSQEAVVTVIAGKRRSAGH